MTKINISSSPKWLLLGNMPIAPMFKHFYITTAALFLLCGSLSAQRQYWAGAGIELAETRGLTGWAYGAQTGVAWRRSYAGIFVRQTTALVQTQNASNLPYSISAQYAGLLGAWHRPAIGTLDVAVGFQLGLGRAVRTWDRPLSLPNDKDAILIAVPFVGLELPIGQRFRIAAHSGYRFFGGLDGIENWHGRDFWALANSVHLRVNFGRK